MGQNKNSFGKTFNNHRANWTKLQSKFYVKNISDDPVLFKHYNIIHNENLTNLYIDKAYKVVFMEKVAKLG